LYHRIGIKLASSGEKFGDARERQLHKLFPAAAFAAPQL
jgi:hypothetical protein